MTLRKRIRNNLQHLSSIKTWMTTPKWIDTQTKIFRSVGFADTIDFLAFRYRCCRFAAYICTQFPYTHTHGVRLYMAVEWAYIHVYTVQHHDVSTWEFMYKWETIFWKDDDKGSRKVQIRTAKSVALKSAAALRHPWLFFSPRPAPFHKRRPTLK